MIVATAMPTILAHLGDVPLYSWVFAAYTLASIAALPVFGALSGRWGLQRTMALALGVFIAGSAICALAPSMRVLLAGRGVQGIGAGGLFALPFILISQRFPATLQPKALALTSAVWGVSSLSGPLVGALLLELWGWQAIFWVNLPLGALVLALGWRGLYGTPAGDPDAAPTNLVSPILLTLATGLLFAAPTASIVRGVLLVAGLASAVAFVAVERRSQEPIVPRGAWRARGPLGAALAVIALATLAFFAAETFLPLLVQSGRGRSAVEVGMLITAGAVAWTLGALWSGRQTYPRPRRSVVLGLGVLLLGAVLLLLVIALLPISVAYGAWILAGLGMGMIVQNSTVVVLDNARGPQATSITAAGQLALGLGTVAGTALADLAAQIGFGPSFTPDHTGGLIDGAQLALLERGVAYAIVLAIAAGLVTMLVAMRLPHQRQRDDEPVGVGQ